MSTPPTPRSPGSADGSGLLRGGSVVGEGRFQLVQELGKGGMGAVWLAQDRSLSERVALKFLTAEIHSDQMALEDLRRETRRSHQLSHPNIVRIHDLYEKAGEIPFISMEYVDGPTLNKLRFQQPQRVLSWEFLRPFVQQLCLALDYAHGEGVVHRDLKPANLMLDSRQRLKLADFGIAATVSDAHSRRAVQPPASGTLPFMSPQQMEGRPPAVTDDIYSLGATLYELLTSRPPFYMGDIRWQVQHLSPAPLEDRLAELEVSNLIPADVQSLVMACLAKRPDERPRSAKAIAAWVALDLGSAPGIEEVGATLVSAKAPAPPRPLPGRPGPESPRAGPVPPATPGPEPRPPLVDPPPQMGRTSYTLAVAVAAVCLAVLGYVGWQFVRPHPPRPYPAAEPGNQLPPEDPPEVTTRTNPSPPSSAPAPAAPAAPVFRVFRPLPGLPVSEQPVPAGWGLAFEDGMTCLAALALGEADGEGASPPRGQGVRPRLCLARWNSELGGSGGLTTEPLAGEGLSGGWSRALNEAGGQWFAGWFSGQIRWGDAEAVSDEGSDILVGMRRASPPRHWLARAGGTGNDRALGIAADRDGNCYVTGSFERTARFYDADEKEHSKLQSAGGKDGFALKLGPLGRVQWVRDFGWAQDDAGTAIAASPEGEVWVAGRVVQSEPGLVGPGAPVRCGFGLEDLWLAKFTTMGSNEWVVCAGSPQGDAATALALDASGNCHLAGYLGGAAQFGNVVVTNAGDKDAVLAKYAPNGELLWVTRAGGRGEDAALAVAVAPGDGVYLAGFFGGEADFQAKRLMARGRRDAFVAKYIETNGAPLLEWVIGGLGAGEDWIAGLAVRGRDDLLLAGVCEGSPVGAVGDASSWRGLRPCLGRLGPQSADRQVLTLPPGLPTKGALIRSVVTNALELHYTFEGMDTNDVVWDLSGRGRHGRARRFSVSKDGQGCELRLEARNSFIEVRESNWASPSDLALAVWFKVAGTTPHSRRLLDQRAGDAGFALSLLGSEAGTTNAGHLMLEVGSQECRHPTFVADNRWHLAVATIQDTVQRLYVDDDEFRWPSVTRLGEARCPRPLLIGINDAERIPPETPRELGFREDASLDGWLAQVLIFKGALEKSVVKRLHERGPH